MNQEDNPTFNEMQQVKRRLFAMRNGIVADALRKGGSPFSIIFGVNLPQLVEIAQITGKNRDLAEQLWANSTTRESMLLAPMLMPVESFTKSDAERWLTTVTTIEVADILCHRLLRHTPYAIELVDSLVNDESDLLHYTGLRLMCNLMGRYPDKAKAIGQAELRRNDPKTQLIALRLIDTD